MNYILIELPKKKHVTSLNYFVEYHGKSDIDGHFGLLQKAFNSYERKKDILSLEDLLWCFKDYFNKVDTDATFEIYEDPGRTNIVKKLKVSEPRVYLSFISDGSNILGSSLSTFNECRYVNIDCKTVYMKETRKSKYAPKIKCKEELILSSFRKRIMGKRVAQAI